MDTDLLPAHHLLRGRYRIVAQVGQGGIAAVYQAEDTALGNRLVAIKETRRSGLSPQDLAVAAEQFRHEASLLAGLRHPNLPHLDEQFQEAGHQYLVLEFIEGEPLEMHLQRAPRGRLLVEEVLQVGIQLASVLEYLHTHQPPILFRDLKPANILRTSTGHLYLIDFGRAHLYAPGQAKDTRPFGSPGYAAPEQLDNTQTDGRSDIYSLGAVLYQALSGHDPASNTPLGWHFPPLQIADLPELASLIFQMVQPAMQERPASMTEVKWRLQALAEVLATRHQGRVAPGPGRPVSPSAVQVQPVAGVMPSPSRPAASRRGKLIAASLSGLVAAIMVLAVLLIPKWASGTPLLGEKTLCIASEFPTTGPDGDVGQPAENGVTLAVAEQSALGSGYTLEVRNFNDVSPTTGIHDPEQGAQNVQQMLQDPCIVGMVGPFNSGVAAAEMPIAAYGDLAMISPSNTNPGLTLPQYAQQYGFDYAALHPATHGLRNEVKTRREHRYNKSPDA